MSAGGTNTAGRGAGARYQPALDGLRALCLLAVLLFHSDFAIASGGFLGVSTFFTLSGFLITSLLLAEWDGTSAVSFGGFWKRRLRRLLPASVLGIALVLASSPWWLSADQRERVAADAVAALGFVVNWRYVRADYAYEAIFTAPSALQHFWSLAVEAQFYLFFPLFVGVCLRFVGGRRGLWVVVTGLAIASAGLAFVHPLTDVGRNRIYFGTDTRVVEILIGALLAMWTTTRPPSEQLRRLVALPALLVLIAAWVGAQVGDAWLYRGGLVAYAVASALLLLGVTGEGGAVRSLLATPVLRWIGKISYGAYVYHWPLFLWLDADRTGLGPVALFAVRLVSTLALAGLSYRFVEDPIRRAQVVRDGVVGRATLAAIGATALLAFAIAPDAMREWAQGWTAPLAAEKPAEGRTYGIFGDSVAMTLAPALRTFLNDRGIDFKNADAVMGCGMVGFGQRRTMARWATIKAACWDDWEAKAEEKSVDVAIVLAGVWDTRNWRMGKGARATALGEPQFDQALASVLGAAMDALSFEGRRVIWLTQPHIGVPPEAPAMGIHAVREASEPARVDRLNELIRQAAARRPRVQVVDLASWVERWPDGEYDLGLRYDKVHFTRAGATAIVENWLGEQILQSARPGS